LRQSARLDAGTHCTERPCGHHRAKRNELRDRNAGSKTRSASAHLAAPARIVLRFSSPSEIPASTAQLEIESGSSPFCATPIMQWRSLYGQPSSPDEPS